MFSPVVRRARAGLGIAAILILVSACAGDEILGPPVAGACVAGRVASRDAVYTARLDGRTCRVWSAWEYDFVAAEAWTLEAKAKTAYVIRVVHADSTSVVAPEVNLFVYGRNPAGDPVRLTRGLRRFGRDGRNVELFLPVDSAATYSLGVELSADQDSLDYRLEVSTCALLELPADTLVSGINSNGGCFAQGAGWPRARVTFLAFRNVVPGAHIISFRRRAGAARVYAEFAGYGVDLASFQYASFLRQGAIGAEYEFTRSLDRIGRTTLLLAVHADSGATLEARATAGVTLRASNH